MPEFRSTPAIAERENRRVALLTLVAVPITLILLRGEHDPLLLAAFGVGGAVIAYLFYRWRDGRARIPVLRLDDHGLEAIGTRRPRRVRWADVRSARRSTYGGVHWTIEHEGGRDVVRLVGFTNEQQARIDALLAARAAHAREGPLIAD